MGGGEGVPAFLKAKRVLSLDMGLLIAGAKERGELELRVTRLLQETRDAGDVILMCGLPCLNQGLRFCGAVAGQNPEGGELEQRVTRLPQETREAGEVILMCGSLKLLEAELVAARMHSLHKTVGKVRPPRQWLLQHGVQQGAAVCLHIKVLADKCGVGIYSMSSKMSLQPKGS